MSTPLLERVNTTLEMVELEQMLIGGSPKCDVAGCEHDAAWLGTLGCGHRAHACEDHHIALTLRRTLDVVECGVCHRSTFAAQILWRPI